MNYKEIFLLAAALALPLQAKESIQGNDLPIVELASLSDYLSHVLEHNPKLQAMKSRVDAAQSVAAQSGTLPNPMFQVTHFVESVQTRTGPQENVFMLSQRFPWFGTLGGKKDAATADAQAFAYAYWNQQLTLLRNVAGMFFEYGYTGKAIELTGENMKLLEQLEPIVETRVQSGGDLNELLRLKVEIGKLSDKLASLQQQRIAQSSMLNAMLNLPAQELRDWPVWDAPAPIHFDMNHLARSLEEKNPELRRLEQSISAAKARGVVAQKSSYPDFMLGVNYIQTGDPEVNPATPDAGEDPWSITAAISIPLWVGKNKAERKEALAREHAAEDDRINRSNELQADLQTRIALLEDANRRLTLYGKELLGLAELAVENSRTSYEGGRAGILEVIDSERSLLDLQLIYWRAAADAWKEGIAIQTLAESDLEIILKQTQEEVMP